MAFGSKIARQNQNATRLDANRPSALLFAEAAPVVNPRQQAPLRRDNEAVEK
jgi:hypothetical protein